MVWGRVLLVGVLLWTHTAAAVRTPTNDEVAVPLLQQSPLSPQSEGIFTLGSEIPSGPFLSGELPVLAGTDPASWPSLRGGTKEFSDATTLIIEQKGCAIGPCTEDTFAFVFMGLLGVGLLASGVFLFVKEERLPPNELVGREWLGGFLTLLGSGFIVGMVVEKLCQLRERARVTPLDF